MARASRYFFRVLQMFQPKPDSHLPDVVRAKVLARFELAARCTLDDCPVGRVTRTGRKFPASRLVRDAAVVNFELVRQDKSWGNSHLCFLSSRRARRLENDRI